MCVCSVLVVWVVVACSNIPVEKGLALVHGARGHLGLFTNVKKILNVLLKGF